MKKLLMVFVMNIFFYSYISNACDVTDASISEQKLIGQKVFSASASSDVAPCSMAKNKAQKMCTDAGYQDCVQVSEKYVSGLAGATCHVKYSGAKYTSERYTEVHERVCLKLISCIAEARSRNGDVSELIEFSRSLSCGA